MNESNATMQSDEAEDLLIGPQSATYETMTFNKFKEVIPPETLKPEISDECNRIDNGFTEFQEINLEDDIEKVEVTSQDSSCHAESLPDANQDVTRNQAFSSMPEQNSNDSVKSWLQKITDGIQTPPAKKITTTPSNISTTTSNYATNAPSRIVKYQDLPYMGEMTLDNSKPRRGRKPKKADICHLIYKNYGTILPGTPNPDSYLEKENCLKKPLILEPKELNENLNRSRVQNRIISSLLEKRLTQEYMKTKSGTKTQVCTNKERQNEPLNLCIRDLNHLKIRLLKRNDNTYSSELKHESHSEDEDNDVEFVNETPSPSSLNNELLFPPMTPDSLSTSSPDIPNTPNTPENSTAPGGYVYWPNAGVFIHPMALQQHLMMYQRLANNNSYTLPSHSPRPPPEKRETPELRKLEPKAVLPKKQDIEETETQSHETKTKRNASNTQERTPAKRKRSAIFIPPIPAENTANPATEVSICKFKFTGGAKPSLQEKKMLSVDSGGNFRYYSGTGDKSMRGYEFFPRETLQQQVNSAQGSSTGAFLQASGEKIYPVPPIESKCSSDFLLTPEIPPASLSPMQDASLRHKKRRSRKSLQREKLEQTFKEKGFLIQTQQLESAEGATYCKFRQLRKFTRYLFRSWKDYLPGNVAEIQEKEKTEEDVNQTPEKQDGFSVT